MEGLKVACFDVYYYSDFAKACCIVFEVEPYEKVISQYCEIIKPVNDYIPGEFYKRELPCILKVYNRVREDICLAIIDGFVTLDKGKEGLGGHMFKTLNKNTPIIGVAKTFYKGCEDYIEVFRGESKRPLFVTSVGIDLNFAAKLIKNLNGKDRIPDVLKKVDLLTRK